MSAHPIETATDAGPDRYGRSERAPGLAILPPRPAESRYGQTRWAEIWLASVMTAYGAALIGAAKTSHLATDPVVWTVVGEDAAGLVAVIVGCARLVALWYNGSRQRSPLVRAAGCAAGFLLYAALAVGLLLSAPLLPTGLVYGILAVAELHASSHAARDAVAYDSLGRWTFRASPEAVR